MDEPILKTEIEIDYALCRGGVYDLLARLFQKPDEDCFVTEYQRVFGHTAHGQVPPYETEYGMEDLFRQAQELADIGGFYRAFGLQVDKFIFERPDHASVECEFMAFLCLKEARCLKTGEAEDLTTVRNAEKLFLKEHLGRFGRAFARAFSKETRLPFYKKAADLLFRFLTLECERFRVQPGPEFIKLSAIKEPKAPMACGTSCGAVSCLK